ncbi:DUF899 domain-containing protein [Sphingomonas sp. 7/4-4]|uniref:DUF899 domain-containing protein n=1 Tax=Sphingomonas sp. 7/4-4 TaxID=3018446 RepID=UPI0022F37FB1|nr:DUF899 domain-containing protein [Sphingomonas sp. 7/4-4]WBY09051.1 DUF899 domain-containing protein [Sphingomonas sp. 7/4-4]
MVAPEAWEAARADLLVKEKAHSRARDALAAERRRMPWMAVDKDYVFEGPGGKMSLLDLFAGRSQLIVYRAFFEPGVFGWPDHACRGCSLGADQVSHLAHLNARDTTLVYASRAPQADIARLKARMGWDMPWVTMTDDFDKDFGVDEWHGHNVFIRDGDRIYRTYFINNRGDEAVGTVWSYLDLTPLGRQEVWEDLARGLSADADVQMVELARQLRNRGRSRSQMGRSVGRRRGGVPQRRQGAMIASRAADALALAAAPGFALMALLTAQGGGAADMLCAAASPFGGMVPMYLLMSVVHAGPWLRRFAQASRNPSPMAARACSDSDETTG